MKKFVILFTVLFFGFFQNVDAQILDRLAKKAEDKVKREAEERAERRVDNGIDKVYDKTEEGIDGVGDEKTNEEKEKTVNETEGEATDPQKNQEPKQEKIAMQTYSKFDFIAGEKVIFFDDFTETAVGDFPPNWNTNASGEVVTNNIFPGNWFQLIGEGSISLDEGIDLPDNYTIEFDVIPHASGDDYNNYDFGFYIYGAENPKDLYEGGAVPGTSGGIKMSFGSRGTYSAYQDGSYTLDGIKDEAIMEVDQKYRLSFWVQKTRLRVYQNQVKIFDLPKVFKQGFQANMMRFELWGAGSPMVSNFRVAIGQPDMRSKLITEGKLVSYGIYFDVNKDVVKPESYGTLKGIADVLKENPTVRVKIVGHTDADGADKSNLDLSKRRGESVKNELVKTFGIDASRLEFDGMGETQPIAPNDTSVNKALNRRVEFVKL